MKDYIYELQIKEHHLDTFGHVNHATYLTLLEEARWEITTKNGLGLKKIQDSGIGPVILSANINYKKEIQNRDWIIIKTSFSQVKPKLFNISQSICSKDGQIYAEANLLGAIWDTKKRKIISPTEDWAKILR